MAAPFTNANYQSLITILSLPANQYRQGSRLRYHCQRLEQLDNDEGSDFVEVVQQAISHWETANDAMTAAIASDDAIGVQSQSVPGEYAVSWGGRGATAKYDNYRLAMRKAEADIIRLLGWEKTNRYSGRTVKSVG